MNKIFNFIFIILKFLLLICSFSLCVYIMMYMYLNLKKEPWGKDFFEFISVIIPFAILLVFFILNFIMKNKNVNGNILYNASCTVSLGAILFMEYRSMMDQNMILWHKTDYHINFEYFADQIFQIKVILYLLTVINLFLIIEGYLNKKKELIVE